MLWYDIFFKNSTLLTKIKIRSINKLKLKNLNLLIKSKTSNHVLSLVIPSKWHLIVLSNSYTKTKHINIYSSVYFNIVPILFTNSILHHDPHTNQFFIKVKFINNFILLYFMLLSKFYKSLLKPSFQKLTFKGKGYYIYKNYRNTITPQFGYSHRLYLYTYYINVVFLSKTSLIVFGLNSNHVNLVSMYIKNWRSINIFTGRGVRFSRQILYKKSGKVSTYR
jgi:hypothetical protein